MSLQEGKPLNGIWKLKDEAIQQDHSMQIY
jgi:hypothetical protein